MRTTQKYPTKEFYPYCDICTNIDMLTPYNDVTFLIVYWSIKYTQYTYKYIKNRSSLSTTSYYLQYMIHKETLHNSCDIPTLWKVNYKWHDKPVYNVIENKKQYKTNNASRR